MIVGPFITPTFSSDGTVSSYAGSGCADGSADVTLTDEITFSELLAFVYGRFSYVAWSAWSNITYTTGVFLAQFLEYLAWPSDYSDAVGFSAQQAEYQFRFRVPKGSRCYKLEWDVNYEYINGDDPDLIEHKTFEWDGVVPEGYDEGDQSTWPVSPVYEIPYTTAADFGFQPGNVTVVNLKAICDDCRPEE